MDGSAESAVAMIHVDTSFLIKGLRAGSPESEKLRAWARAEKTIVVSAVAWTEFLCGPLDEREASLAAALVDRQLDYTMEMTAIAARLFNDTGRRRSSLPDCMIAAAAIAEETAIATGSPRNFARFEEHGLMIA